MNPSGGKIQLNQMPEIVKKMLRKDSNVLDRLKNDKNLCVKENSDIWCFPKFRTTTGISQITDAIYESEQSGNPLSNFGSR